MPDVRPALGKLGKRCDYGAAGCGAFSEIRAPFRQLIRANKPTTAGRKPEADWDLRGVCLDNPSNLVINVRLRMRRESSSVEGEALQRRRWPRLPLAIPVFVRGADAQGKDFIEFSTLLNESAGGALLAIRRSLRASSRISLEIPSAAHPPSAALPPAVRMLRARVVRITHLEDWYLCGVQFVRPMGRGPRTGMR